MNVTVDNTIITADRLVVYEGYLLRVDAAATQRAYSLMTAGGAERCSCDTCRNWLALRDGALPDSFLRFLENVGVDWRRDVEVVHHYRRGDGLHRYSGCYHCIGEIIGHAPTKSPVTDDVGVDVSIAPHAEDGREHASLRDVPLVIITFTGCFRWKLTGGREPE